ncbi:MAG: hypothetical protein IKK10_05530 [Clostridia bacterium]|nr:hypothetical protein [Clostridia bacterium]
MKKLSLFIVAIFVSMLLFGCNNNVDVNNNNADKDLVGTWQVADENQMEYYIFKDDGKVRIVRGSVYFEGDAVFEANSDGSRKYTSDFYYMNGELTYTIADEKATFDDGEGNVMVLEKADYKAPVLDSYADFNSKNPLVGTWYNDEYNDTYTFNSDGTAEYKMDLAELSYVSGIEYNYNEKDGSIYFTYDDGTGSKETVSTYEINGDTLIVDGTAEYTRK